MCECVSILWQPATEENKRGSKEPLLCAIPGIHTSAHRGSPWDTAVLTCALLEELRGSQSTPWLQDINRRGPRNWWKCAVYVRLCAFALEHLRTRFVYDPRLPDYRPACLALICLRIRPGVLDPASGLRRLYWITGMTLLLAITSHSQLQSKEFVFHWIHYFQSCEYLPPLSVIIYILCVCVYIFLYLYSQCR